MEYTELTAVVPHDGTIPPGCIPCRAEYHASSWLVTFENGTTLLLQSDYDQAAFAVSCGVIRAPADWDGCPTKLGKAIETVHPDNIRWCSDEYLDVEVGR